MAQRRTCRSASSGDASGAFAHVGDETAALGELAGAGVGRSPSRSCAVPIAAEAIKAITIASAKAATVAASARGA